MIFTAPLALVGLFALPAIVYLLRLNPPPARRVTFPPLALLQDLASQQRTPRRIPLWLLLLRLSAAALIIFGLAAPSLHPPPALPGIGPVLLVIDNGWSSAADWQARRDAAQNIAAAAARADRGVAVLATAPDASGMAPRITGVMAAVQAGQIIDALQPLPWPVDRRLAAAALRNAPQQTRIYIADGITDGPGFSDFLTTLSPNRILSAPTLPALLLAPHLGADGSLAVHLDNPPPNARVTARTANGDVLTSAPVSTAGDSTIALPLPLADQITAVSLDGPPTAGGTLLLDSSTRADLIGVAAGGFNAETPFLSPLYFIRRALPDGSQYFTGDLRHLIASKADVIVLADAPLDPEQQAEARAYLAQGGILIRFAGPITAAAPDPVTPDPLLSGDRRLGGALTWTAPQTIAPTSAGGPLSGLPGDSAVTVSRQILADPTRLSPSTVWVRLSDGTPLVLGTPVGSGYLVYFLTSANADWSNLALSGLFPSMLKRVTGLAHGAAPRANLLLSLQSTLSAFGTIGPGVATTSLTAGQLAITSVSPAHPPGLYGSGGVSIALNLGGHVPAPAASALPSPVPLTGQPNPRNFGPGLIATAILMLAFDLMISLIRRGMLGVRRIVFFLAIIVLPTTSQAQNASLQAELGYIRTGNPATDQITVDGLTYLSADVSAHTSAQLANPVGLDPAVDDLSLYPLIYWPILPGVPPPAPASCAALTGYMQHGGLLLIDTTGGDPGDAGSGAGFAPGTGAALAQATACLNLPPLVPLTADDVLAHCFYIVQDFPGRFTGAPVLIAAAAARDADGVTPIIIGENDWAGAWARDVTGAPEQTPLPGGEDQRDTADRFGTNLVIYALTGSYKADQSNVPDLLDKLGQ
jgi:hypothetical protein